MADKAIGVYWTLPVKWAAVRELSDDAEQEHSTIRYQREILRRYANENGLRLVEERTFLETGPDRVSEFMTSELERIIRLACKTQAMVLAVDFAEIQGYRRNEDLRNLAATSDVDFRLLPVDPLLVDDWSFDPIAHFKDRKKTWKGWVAGKANRRAVALDKAKTLKDQGRSCNEVATLMNDEDIPSTTGIDWSAANVRKLLKANAD